MLTDVETTDKSASGTIALETPVPELAGEAMGRIADIQKFLPNRYPLLLLDRIVEHVIGQRITGIKNVSVNELFFQGHFPERPIMPGVLIVEAMAQASRVLLAHLPEFPGEALFLSSIDKVRFRRPVVPGDQIQVSAELGVTSSGQRGHVKARAEVEGQLATEGELVFSWQQSLAATPLTEAANNAPATYPPVLTIGEIQTFLPHRYPFLLVDRIIGYTPGQQIVGLKNVTFNEEFFQGHFPGHPMMPGTLMVEAMAQVGGVLLAQLPDIPGGLLLFAGIDNARFYAPVTPGDQLVITVELVCVKRRRFGKMKAKADVNGHLVAEGDLMFSLVD